MKTKNFLLYLLLALALTVYAQTGDDLVLQGNGMYVQGKWDKAEAFYRQALQVAPQNSIARYNLGNALQKQSKFAEAAEILGPLYPAEGAINAVRSQGAYNQGVAFTKQKKTEESIEAYKNALRINPDDVQARENLQKALREQKGGGGGGGEENKSNSSQSQADKQLQALQEKESKLRQKLQNQNKGSGAGGGRDW